MNDVEDKKYKVWWPTTNKLILLIWFICHLSSRHTQMVFWVHRVALPAAGMLGAFVAATICCTQLSKTVTDTWICHSVCCIIIVTDTWRKRNCHCPFHLPRLNLDVHIVPSLPESNRNPHKMPYLSTTNVVVWVCPFCTQCYLASDTYGLGLFYT